MMVLLICGTTNVMAQELPSFVVTTSLDVVDDQDMVTSLREALSYVSGDGDTITFNLPEYQSNVITLQGAALPNIQHKLVIDGHNQGLQGGLVVIDAQELYRPFIVDQDAYLILDGLIIQNGQSPISEGGGAILNRGELTIRNCRFVNNRSNIGGALYSVSPNQQSRKMSMVMNNCSFEGNVSYRHDDMIHCLRKNNYS